MLVTMKLSVSSVDASYASGHDYDLPEILAKQWIAADYAKAKSVPVVAPAPAPVVAEPVAPLEAPAAIEEPAPAPEPAPNSRRAPRKAKADAPKADLL